MYHHQFRLNPYNRIDELLARTGYKIEQDNGQRIYFNPYNNEDPPRGCELFIGRIPRDIYEDDLVPIFETAGPIFKLRLMMDFNGKNRGFCFVKYFRREVANAAVKLLDGYEVRPGCKIGVFKSLDNTRLFVGGIPVDKTKEDVRMAFSEFVDGIREVIMYPSNTDQSVNRGYVFIEFESHRCAAIARRRLQPGSLVLWDSNIAVDWAEPLPDPDPAIMSKVTKLYCRNISLNLSQDKFEDAIGKVVPSGNVIKIHKKYDYAFINCTNRQTAEEILEKLRGIEIDGRRLEVMWARPEFYSNNYVRKDAPNHFCLSIPAKIRRIIRMRQAMKNQSIRAPMVEGNFMFPPHPPQHFIAPYPAPMPHPLAFPPNCPNFMIL